MKIKFIKRSLLVRKGDREELLSLTAEIANGELVEVVSRQLKDKIELML